jgi:hypothetical protein
MQIVDVKGVPEPAASMMKSATPPAQPPEQECITTAEAAKDMSELMNGSKDKSCRYSDMKSSGGTFSGTAECGNPGEPMQGKGKFAGKVAPEAIDIDLDMTATMAMPGMPGNGTIQMKITRTGKRIGECPGGTK